MCASFFYSSQSIALLFFSMTRVVDFAVQLTGYQLFPLPDQRISPQLPYLSFVTRRQGGSLGRCLLINQLRCPLAVSKLPFIRQELGLVLKPPAFAKAPARQANRHECTHQRFTAKKEGHGDTDITMVETTNHESYP
jgi:hypothetical protein